jgi:hypothetical protein
MATVLTDLYGDHFEFTDSLHVGRPRDEIRNTDFKARHFNSFWQAAEETANSRFYGGIHTPQDNARGLEKGKEIGNNVNHLHWKKKCIIAYIFLMNPPIVVLASPVASHSCAFGN